MAEEVASARSFDGLQKVYKHQSATLGCAMRFGVYLPPAALADAGAKLPVLFYLSGLTCTEENFIHKGGFQRYAAEHGIIVVNPDTSPRGCSIAGEEDAYDFGTGAGFYVDATEAPWSANYRMRSYVADELPGVAAAAVGAIDTDRMGITGHSMGGHGALALFLSGAGGGRFKSASAFAPICNPTECPWGKKAFNGYLGADEKKWREYDATHLVGKYAGRPVQILIDQGGADQFLSAGQLLPDKFVAAAAHNKLVDVQYRLREGYDHSYYFIASFVGEHVAHHAKALKAAA